MQLYNSDTRPVQRGTPPSRVETVAPTNPTTPVAPGAQGELSPFAKVLARVSKEMDKGEALMNKIEHTTGPLPPTELLHLQVGMYRYTESIMVVAKVTDSVMNAVKTVINKE